MSKDGGGGFSQFIFVLAFLLFGLPIIGHLIGGTLDGIFSIGGPLVATIIVCAIILFIARIFRG